MFSIITVCFNSEKTILQTIESIKQQLYTDFEHIFIDGGSTDNTLSIISQCAHPSKVVISEPDSGIYAAMNKGLGLASGDIVLFLNSDDILYDEKTLGLLYNCFAQGNSGIVYGNIEYVDSHNKVSSVWRPGEYYDGNFSNGWSCPHPGFVAKKSLYDRFGGFDESLAIASDFDLMLRFFLQDVKNVYLDITLVKMRDDGISSKTSSIIRGYKEIIGSLKKNKVKFNIFIYTFKRYSPKIKRVLLKNSIRNF